MIQDANLSKFKSEMQSSQTAWNPTLILHHLLRISVDPYNMYFELLLPTLRRIMLMSMKELLLFLLLHLHQTGPYMNTSLKISIHQTLHIRANNKFISDVSKQVCLPTSNLSPATFYNINTNTTSVMVIYVRAATISGTASNHILPELARHSDTIHSMTELAEAGIDTLASFLWANINNIYDVSKEFKAAHMMTCFYCDCWVTVVEM